MAGNVSRKLLKEVSEALGLTLHTLPKHLQDRVRLAEPKNVHPDIMANKTPLIRMLHGTLDPTDFGELSVQGDARQKGVHLTTNPDIANAYATRVANPAGVKPRIYSVLADPGRTLDLGQGLPNWWDPQYFKDTGEWYKNDDIIKLSTMMDESGDVGPLLKNLGYDTAKYEHFIPQAQGADSGGMAYLFPDTSRFVPEWSLAAQAAKKQRGVLGLESPLPMNEWDPIEIQSFLDSIKEWSK